LGVGKKRMFLVGAVAIFYNPERSSDNGQPSMECTRTTQTPSREWAEMN